VTAQHVQDAQPCAIAEGSEHQIDPVRGRRHCIRLSEYRIGVCLNQAIEDLRKLILAQTDFMKSAGNVPRAASGKLPAHSSPQHTTRCRHRERHTGEA
jgi:hypothetical protein